MAAKVESKISITLDKKLKAWVKKTAKKNKVSASAFVRSVLEREQLGGKGE